MAGHVIYRRATRLIVVVVILPATLVCSCTNQQVYNAIQENQRLECSKMPMPQYDRCMKELQTPYDKYEKERQEILEGESK